MRGRSGSHGLRAAARGIAVAGRLAPVWLALGLAACSGQQQSALQPSGSGARDARL